MLSTSSPNKSKPHRFSYPVGKHVDNAPSNGKFPLLTNRIRFAHTVARQKCIKLLIFNPPADLWQPDEQSLMLLRHHFLDHRIHRSQNDARFMNNPFLFHSKDGIRMTRCNQIDMRRHGHRGKTIQTGNSTISTSGEKTGSTPPKTITAHHPEPHESKPVLTRCLQSSRGQKRIPALLAKS